MSSDRSASTPSGSALALRVGIALSGLSRRELWWGYLAMTGELAPAELRAALTGDLVLGPHDHDVVVQVLNERLVELELGPCVRYSWELDRLAPHAGGQPS